jgi:hypothetical protein
MPNQKTTYIKIYQTTAGNRSFIGTAFYDFRSINSKINNGYGDLEFVIPKNFDNFGLDVEIGLKNYEIDIIVYDFQDLKGKVIFSGEITKISRSLGGSESVRIQAVGPIFRLEKTPLKQGNSHIINYNSTTLSSMFKDVIDKYNIINPNNLLSYDSNSIQDTNQNHTIKFNNATCLDALTAIFKATPANFVWFLDVDKKIYLRAISDTPEHFFYFGKDVISIDIDEDKLQITNVLGFWNSKLDIAKEYRNDISIENYGYFWEKKKDDRYSEDGMDDYADRAVTNFGSPNLQIKVKILDSFAGGYNLESVKVGNTCKFLNLQKTSGFAQNMVITSKEDHLDFMVITVSDVRMFTSRELFNLKKSQEQVNYQDGPEFYDLTYSKLLTESGDNLQYQNSDQILI